MKSILIACFLFLLLLMSFKPMAAGGQWQLEMDKEGIRVYTQMEGLSPYKQIKVTTTIDAPMEKVMEILVAFNRYKNWMSHVEDSYLVNQSGDAYYVFFLEDASWPMQNRYQVSRLEVDQGLTHSSVSFRSVPNYIEKRKDAIQIKQSEGYWELEALADHQCTLEYVLIHNPGGYVPPWLANVQAIENPFQSILHLKGLAEDTRISP